MSTDRATGAAAVSAVRRISAIGPTAAIGDRASAPHQRTRGLTPPARPAWAAALTAVAALCLPIATLCAAPPEVRHLLPSGGERGQTIEVAAIGSFPDWPVAAWCSRPEITVVPAAESGKLSVTIPPEAAPGICWIRLHSPGGAAAPRPFVIGHLPEVIERDPNDAPSAPQRLDALPVVVNGRLSGRNDVDVFAVAAPAGRTLVASLDAQQSLLSPLDAVVQILDADGFVLAQAHDVRGADPLLAHPAATEATYLVRVFGFPAQGDATIGFAGGDDYVYRLTLTAGPYLDYVAPLAIQRGQSATAEVFGWNVPEALRTVPFVAVGEEDRLTLFAPGLAGDCAVRVEPHPCAFAAGGTLDEPQPLELPVTVTGRLERPRERDVYGFEAVAADQAFSFQIESRVLGMQVDALLQVLDAEGTVLARADDAGENRDPELVFNAPRPGTYQLVVADLFRRGGGRQAYLLRAIPPQPDFRLSVTEHAYRLAAGAPLEVPVAIERRHGFAGDIAIEVQGLPDGVTAAPCASSAGETAAQVKLVLSGSLAAGAPIRIVGRESSDSPRERTAIWAASPPHRPLWDVWLMPAE